MYSLGVTATGGGEIAKPAGRALPLRAAQTVLARRNTSARFHRRAGGLRNSPRGAAVRVRPLGM